MSQGKAKELLVYQQPKGAIKKVIYYPLMRPQPKKKIIKKIQKDTGEQKYVIFPSESFKYLTTESPGKQSVHFFLAWTETQPMQTVLQGKNTGKK